MTNTDENGTFNDVVLNVPVVVDIINDKPRSFFYKRLGKLFWCPTHTEWVLRTMVEKNINPYKRNIKGQLIGFRLLGFPRLLVKVTRRTIMSF